MSYAKYGALYGIKYLEGKCMIMIFKKTQPPSPPHPSTDKFLPNSSDYYESFFSASVAYFTLLVV